MKMPNNNGNTSEIYGEMGQQIIQLGHTGNHMILYGGGLKVIYEEEECGCRCCGWEKRYEIIPRHIVLGFTLVSSSKFKCLNNPCMLPCCFCFACCQCCHITYTGL